MNQLASKTNFVPAPTVLTIDRCHLGRKALGDRSLERELLQLFDRQAALLIARMRASEPAAVADLAQTLKGLAVCIVAGRVARTAEAVEITSSASAVECRLAIDRLANAVDEVPAIIAELLRARSAKRTPLPGIPQMTPNLTESESRRRLTIRLR